MLFQSSQYLGTIKTPEGVLKAMLCIDGDRRSEVMIHFWIDDQSKAGAILFNSSEETAGVVSLTAVRRYQIDSGGGLEVAPSELQLQLNGLTAKIRGGRAKDTYVGIWQRPGMAANELQFSPPPAGPKLKPYRCKNWDDFKKWVNRVSKGDNHVSLYRGHGSNKFSLSTSLHRTQRTRLERYIKDTLTEFTAHAETVLQRRINLNDPQDYSIALGLAQHHGLPTPLMDWTISPYIASFFAFSDALENIESRTAVTHVRVYGVTDALVNALSPPLISLPLYRPYVSFLQVSALHNPRLYAQQGRFLVTNVSNLEPYLTHVQSMGDATLVVAADIPITSALDAMADLRFMGLTAAALFPGLDGVCRMMKHSLLINSR